MTGYTRHWECNICTKRQETIDYPKVCICERCIEPLANRLCRDGLGVGLNTKGVEREYWIGEAYSLADVLFKNWAHHRPEKHQAKVTN